MTMLRCRRLQKTVTCRHLVGEMKVKTSRECQRLLFDWCNNTKQSRNGHLWPMRSHLGLMVERATKLPFRQSLLGKIPNRKFMKRLRTHTHLDFGEAQGHS